MNADPDPATQINPKPWTANSVADPDTDPDPAFFIIADPDSGSGSRIRIPDPGFYDQKLKKITAEKKNYFFLDQKLQFTYPYRPT